MGAIIQSAGQLVAASTNRLQASRSPSSMRLYVDHYQTYAQIYRAQPNVRTVVTFIARNIASLGVHIIERASETDRIRRRDLAAAAALRQPNPLDRRLTTYRLIEGTLVDLGVYDAAFWAMLPADGLGRPVIVPLPAKNVEVIGHLWPTLYRYHGATGRRLELTPDQVVYFQGSTAPDNSLWGVPPIESLRRVLAEDTEAGIYREQFWRRGARASAVIERPLEAGDWSDGAWGRFRESWDNAYSGHGDGAGGTPILEDGMKLAAGTDVTAQSSQYVESRKLTREEVAAAYHIDPIWVGITGTGESYASVKERHAALYQDDLGPWIAMLEQDMTAQFLPALVAANLLETLSVKINIAEKLRGRPEETAEAINRLVGRPVMTPNEGRAWLDLSSLPEGEGLTVPLNVIVGGQTIPGEAPPAAAAIPAGAAAALAELEAIATKARNQPALPRPRAAGPTEAQIDALRAAHIPAVENAMLRTFERQAAEVLAELGAAGDDATATEIFDRDRFDFELAADLFGLALDYANEVAVVTAEALAFDDLDPEAFEPYLDTNSAKAATNINYRTARQIADALDSAGEDDDTAELVAAVFAAAATARATQIANSRATSILGFAATDTARQAGRVKKVWNVTTNNSRHPEMQGETVPLGANFSNGLAWPGDAAAGNVGEAAGCRCFLTFD